MIFKSIEDLLLKYQKEFVSHIQSQVIFSDNPIVCILIFQV